MVVHSRMQLIPFVFPRLFLFIAITFNAGCDMHDSTTDDASLRAEELEQRATAYSLENDERSALEALNEALKLKPNDVGLLEYKTVVLWNLFCEDNSPDEVLSFCNDHIVRKVGPEVMFRLMKAQVFQTLGTKSGENYSVVITDREQCLAAVSELAIAIDLEPNVATIAEERGWLPVGWEEHFNGLRDFPEFQALGK